MRELFAAFKRFLASPSKAAAEARSPRSLSVNARIYGLFLLLWAVFFWLKPFDFPDANAGLPLTARGPLFWLKAALWQLPVELLLVFLLLGLLEWMREGSLPFKLVCAVGWTLASFVLVVAYAQKMGLSKAALAFGGLVSFAPFALLARRVKKEDARAVLSFLLGVNAVGLPMLAGMALATAAGLPVLFKGAQIAGGFWMIGASAVGLRELSGLRMARAFMAFLLSLFLQILFVLVLYFLGLVPDDILRGALLYG